MRTVQDDSRDAHILDFTCIIKFIDGLTDTSAIYKQLCQCIDIWWQVRSANMVPLAYRKWLGNQGVVSSTKKTVLVAWVEIDPLIYWSPLRKGRSSFIKFLEPRVSPALDGLLWQMLMIGAVSIFQNQTRRLEKVEFTNKDKQKLPQNPSLSHQASPRLSGSKAIRNKNGKSAPGDVWWVRKASPATIIFTIPSWNTGSHLTMIDTENDHAFSNQKSPEKIGRLQTI